MNTKLLGLLACLALISASPASATTTLAPGSTTSDDAGISGLVVCDPSCGTYDVTFVHASYDSVYPSPTHPYFLGNMAGASDAATALAAALNTLSVTDLDGIIPTNVAADELALIPYANSGSVFNYKDAFCSSNSSGCDASWDSAGDASSNFGPRAFSNADFANFAPTPVPAALPLFATGLGAMGLLGWRRKRKAQAAA
jgi:hypothetical protein